MITIGTDCSGIEAPIEALKQLGVPFEHKWACEIDQFARQSILANYNPEIMYTDITKRDHSQLPDVDVYVCGFPCQSFSLMGKKGGTRDPRSNIMRHCIEVIKTKLPAVFILENVKNFKYVEKGKPYTSLINNLMTILDLQGERVYNVYPDIYNTKHYGIPQNRERLYIIGIRFDIHTDVFTKPIPTTCKPLDDFIVDKTVYKLSNSCKNIVRKLKLIDYQKGYIFPNSNYVNPLENVSPTLSTRCDLFFHTSYNRYLTTTECLLLQGFPITFNQAVSKTQLYKQIGNSMSVNVLKVIFEEVIRCTTLSFV
ncbi:DNA (cytosine-5-)-methyltransferase [bacterium]|nr:DNA (cytosine-5-)-methyltransferase [bacterium]NDC94592.1 DNA (cytosine-5-)-methyltransferase [bacterium]NDD84754.1 DNA (cytosine-5-)-methyltransferase [bacterium]NDG31018.1 DNA (cytosine-5-)-methyltransferase [bacterium]